MPVPSASADEVKAYLEETVSIQSLKPMVLTAMLN